MKVYLNEITGMADALVSMYMSKRTWTPELDKEIRDDWCLYNKHYLGDDELDEWQRTEKRIESFCKYAWMHTTIVKFVMSNNEDDMDDKIFQLFLVGVIPTALFVIFFGLAVSSATNLIGWIASPTASAVKEITSMIK